MGKCYKVSIAGVAVAAIILYTVSAAAIPVKCGTCPEDHPCATLFEFRNVRFIHHVFCRVDESGREVWDSYDEEKFDLFYFEHPDNKKDQKEIDM